MVTNILNRQLNVYVRQNQRRNIKNKLEKHVKN